MTKLTPADAKAIAQDGYIFGLPLVYIAVQADTQTNVAKPEGGRAPFNQFDHHREFPNAKNNKIVGMNVDTLYSLANVDLSAEPIVLVVPPMAGQPLVAHADHRRVERRAGRTRLAHARRQGRQLRACRPELQGHAARRPGGDPCRYQPRRDRRADLHRREGRL